MIEITYYPGIYNDGTSICSPIPATPLPVTTIQTTETQLAPPLPTIGIIYYPDTYNDGTSICPWTGKLLSVEGVKGYRKVDQTLKELEVILEEFDTDTQPVNFSLHNRPERDVLLFPRLHTLRHTSSNPTF
jgi:hypothetical protein